ncbi:ATP-dependent DNA helicase [Trichonephila clavipes]|nr:ATP-dependent DNA helicase [Trichonephila clavipes]
MLPWPTTQAGFDCSPIELFKYCARLGKLPTVRRRDVDSGGRSYELCLSNGVRVDIDNRCVVPYSPLLVGKNCHSGPKEPQEDIGGNRDESLSLALWRIFSFPVNERDPEVIHFAVHLDNGRRVYFTEQTVLQQALTAPKAILTEFFNLCNQQDAVARQGGFFFLDAPGGTGKALIILLILARIRSQNHIALGIVSSGIEATLLDGGRTAHSALKVPLNVHTNPDKMCIIKKHSGIAEVLRKCKIIIWDECTMAHKLSLEALNRSLKDIKNNTRLFGGALLLLSGDFRLTIPVVPRATYADEINAYIGNGRIPLYEYIQLPGNFCNIGATKGELIKSVFPYLRYNYIDPAWLHERAILAEKVLNVDAINFKLQQSLPGNEITFKSIDTVVNPDEVVNYPVKFLNSLDLYRGMPPHNLRLKIGSPIILLRNLKAPKLCNGTRLVIKNHGQHS